MSNDILEKYSENVLAHHGIPGMKWGVRRYQNADGTLTPAGKKRYNDNPELSDSEKKRIESKYTKIASKGMNEWHKHSSSTYVKAYNKAADTMNNGGIDKFNADQEKKYGKDYAKRDGYVGDYEKQFNELLNQNLNEALNSFYATNKNIQKANEFAEKYGMYNWSEFAKQNKQNMEEVKSVVEKSTK